MTHAFLSSVARRVALRLHRSAAAARCYRGVPSQPWPPAPLPRVHVRSRRARAHGCCVCAALGGGRRAAAWRAGARQGDTSERQCQHRVAAIGDVGLQRAHVPLSSISVVMEKVGDRTPLVALNAGKPMMPASTMKLVTTYAGLSMLGPDYRWRTSAYADGTVDAKACCTAICTFRARAIRSSCRKN